MSTSRIAVLPPALADQIAAGEVVERAASVVKELCENAIDAGARRIEVEVEGGGGRAIRVVDDGSGMTPDEARLALRRHATSKIRSADDLWGLATFGFRGEALPSIAAVSRLTLSTKLPGAAAGFRLTVEAGVETDAREAGIPVGTQIEVRDLFFNTPARLKFQKTEATESANVGEAVLRLALAHPEVHFRLRAGGRMVLDLPAHQRLGERVRAAFARRGAGALHESLGEEGGHQVHAFLAAPEEASTTARSTFLFVGRRFIRDRSLLHALSQGYGELLEKGRYPLAALFLDVPGAELDVNVHPQKLEVRFARAAEVYAAVRHVVADGIARAPWLSRARGVAHAHTLPLQSVPGTPSDFQKRNAGNASVLVEHSHPTSPARGGGWYSGNDWRPRDPAGTWATGIPSEVVEDRYAVPPVARAADGAAFLDADGPSFPTGPLEPDAAMDRRSAGLFFQSLAYIGQLHQTYLVCEGAGELVLIDQHVAQERVAFERMRAAHGTGNSPRQRLLFPVPIEVGAEAGAGLAAITQDAVAILETLGFEIELSGGTGVPAGGQLLLRAVPEALKDADPKPLLQEILGQMGPAGLTPDRLDLILRTMACHSVDRSGGDALDRPRALALLAQLVQLAQVEDLDLGAHRPHGRPVVLRLAVPEIDRRFDRRQD